MNNFIPRVSVVIPAYNAMEYLPLTIKSVLKQTYKNFEVLIVNDGSSDHIKEWYNTFINDKRIKLINQYNQGLSAARNTGICNANGLYIAFVDADDLWSPNKLEIQVTCLDANPQVGLIYNWAALIDADGKLTGRVLGHTYRGDVLEEILQRNIIDCPSVIVRKECFEKLGLFDCALKSVEDWDMWIRISCYYDFAVSPIPLVYYRQHPSNMSKNWHVMEESFYCVIDKSYKLVSKKYQRLKDNSLGYANLCLAWKAIQSKDHNSMLARSFQKRAISNYPLLRYSIDNIRLTAAIFLLNLLGTKHYFKLLYSTYALRRFFRKKLLRSNIPPNLV